MSRVPKKIALQPLMAGASVCPGGVLEDEPEPEDINQIARTEGRKAVAEVAAHEQKMLAAEQKMLVAEYKFNKMLVGDSTDDSISDDELEGVPLAGNWCE